MVAQIVLNVTSTTSPTKIFFDSYGTGKTLNFTDVVYNGNSIFNSLVTIKNENDVVLWRGYTFPSTGHTTLYLTLTQDSLDNSLRSNESLYSVVLPEGLTAMTGGNFRDCQNLKEVIFPSTLVSLENNEFVNGMTSSSPVLISYATTAPSFNPKTESPLRGTFLYIAQNGTLYYPTGSNYSSWLSNDEYCLGYYGWNGVASGLTQPRIWTNIHSSMTVNYNSYYAETVCVWESGCTYDHYNYSWVGNAITDALGLSAETHYVTNTNICQGQEGFTGYRISLSTTMNTNRSSANASGTVKFNFYDTDNNVYTEDVIVKFVPQNQTDSSQTLTFIILSSGTITWKTDDATNAKTISYSKNNGSTWTTITSTTAGTSFNVTAGEIVLFKGDNACYGGLKDGNFIGNTFGGTAKFIAEGNIMSLVNSTGFSTATTLQSAYTFFKLFYNCAGLISAEQLILPATALTDGCYRGMFGYCHKLTTAPSVLPATTLTDFCYAGMFYYCTSLTSAPALPATSLAYKCYYEMFYDCSSLTSAPALPATTLADNCYQGMFVYCTGLTSAPELPAATLTEACYDMMFYNCSNLNYIKCLATDISAPTCTYEWVYGVASAGTFVKDANMTDWEIDSIDGIPIGWTVHDASGSTPGAFDFELVWLYAGPAYSPYPITSNTIIAHATYPVEGSGNPNFQVTVNGGVVSGPSSSSRTIFYSMVEDDYVFAITGTGETTVVIRETNSGAEHSLKLYRNPSGTKKIYFSPSAITVTSASTAIPVTVVAQNCQFDTLLGGNAGFYRTQENNWPLPEGQTLAVYPIFGNFTGNNTTLYIPTNLSVSARSVTEMYPLISDSGGEFYNNVVFLADLITEQEAGSPEGLITASPDPINAVWSANSVNVFLTLTNCQRSVNDELTANTHLSSVDWMSVTVLNETATTFNFSANTSSARSTYYIFCGRDGADRPVQKRIEISQSGYGMTVTITPERNNLTKEAGSFTCDVRSTVPGTFSFSASPWLTITRYVPTSSTGGTLYVDYAENPGAQRTGTIWAIEQIQYNPYQISASTEITQSDVADTSYIRVTPESASLSRTSGVVEFDVTYAGLSGTPVLVEGQGNMNIISYDFDGSVVTIYYGENDTTVGKNKSFTLTGTTSNGRVITKTFTLSQGGNGAPLSPVWRDYVVSLDAPGDGFINYDITFDGEVIYTGRAYSMGQGNIYICLNQLIKSYLSNYIDFTDGYQTILDWMGEFFVSSPELGSIANVGFYEDYSYENRTETNVMSLNNPITNEVVEGGYVPFSFFITGNSGSVSITENGSTIQSLTINDNEQHRYFITAENNKVYQSLGATYKTIPMCEARYSIYYVNSYGGVDVLPFKGRSNKKTDNITRLNYTKTFWNNSLEFENVNYMNEIKAGWELQTGWMSDTASKKMHELVESTCAFLYDAEEQKYTPIVMTDKKLEYKTFKNQNNRFYNYTINVEESQSKERR